MSGPNQGGKTTFARMFGQLNYLARLGCPIPGTQAKMFLANKVFTHFEKEESIITLRGKLHEIFSVLTSNSILIINEIFTSTTLKDSIYLSKEMLKRIESLDIYTVIVTFIDELSIHSEKTISMISTIVPDNPLLRTFKIIRKESDGLAYAISIAKKHRLTYDQIMERFRN